LKREEPGNLREVGDEMGTGGRSKNICKKKRKSTGKKASLINRGRKRRSRDKPTSKRTAVAGDRFLTPGAKWKREFEKIKNEKETADEDL